MERAGTVTQTLVEKLRALPPLRQAQVEDFIDFLRQRSEDDRLVWSAMELSEQAFRKVWETPEDAVYDKL